MEISLLDYEGTKNIVEIPDDTEYISGVILNGDMVMEYPFHMDSSEHNPRTIDYYDGYFKIERKDFHKLNEEGASSYDFL